MIQSAYFRAIDISIKFGSLEALKNVNFDVEKGEIFGIAGPNGAGKTTLLNAVMGTLLSGMRKKSKRISGRDM